MPGTAIRPEKYDSPYERGRTALLRKLVPAGAGRAALDLGCGCGFHTALLADRAWRVTAVDVEATNIAAVAHADRRLVGSAPAILSTFQTREFQFALCLELVEHLHEREELVRGLRRVADSLVISTPNRMSTEGLGGYYWGERARGWGKWNAWDNTHVYIYSSVEFIRLLKRCGWTVKQVIGYWYNGGLPLGLKLRVPFSHSTVWPLNRLGFNLIVACD